MAEKSNFAEHTFRNRTVIVEKSAEQEQKIMDKLLSHYTQVLLEKERAEKEFLKRLAQLKAVMTEDEYKQQLEEYQLICDERVQAEQTLAAEKLKIQSQVDTILTKHAQETYDKMSLSERRAYHKKVADNLKSELEFLSTKKIHE